MAASASTGNWFKRSVLTTIDWTRPWLASVLDAAGTLDLEHASLIEALNCQAAARKLHNERGMALSFVPQSELPEGMAYEAFIGATACVPTRANLHDFFNALVWLTFPLIKRQLNALQSARIASDGIGKSRGAARDGATLFDENSALLVVRDAPAGQALIDALRMHDWHSAFVARRACFGEHAEVCLFGHALMDKLVKPYKAITAHAWVVLADDAFFTLAPLARRAWIDLRVAQQLAERSLSSLDFTPLPVLGVPGWWPGQDAAFYADASVFRPRRSQ
jgi:hypothetical protein